MTFQQIVSQTKTKYHTTNEVVIFDIIYSLSKIVKDKLSFTQHRKDVIDFSKTKFIKLTNDYFVKKKPLGAITKQTKFYGLDIKIFPKIFNPRPETEMLCDRVVKYLKQHRSLGNVSDLCCGTGALGLAIKKHCP
jgi:release factor glutamine methyltransferase